jgi:hypothetical protein
MHPVGTLRRRVDLGRRAFVGGRAADGAQVTAVRGTRGRGPVPLRQNARQRKDGLSPTPL